MNRMVAARARELGIPFQGDTGSLNSITDVKGVQVGHRTLNYDLDLEDGGTACVRTGVTSVLPLGPLSKGAGVFAGCHVLNGCGEMTGTHWVEESGFLYGPVVTTNTYSVGVAHEAAIRWASSLDFETGGLPVVAETWDGYLNDIQGFHVKHEHVLEALNSAHGGRVEEGCVGGGTGMVCHGFKGGIGTSSRIVSQREIGGEHVVGVLVQANHGRREQLTIAGVPVGRLLSIRSENESDAGSIIVVAATDAPLLPHQLKRLARRVSLGVARVGSTSGNSSGDIFIAFSTAHDSVRDAGGYVEARYLPNSFMNPLFEATAQATEEAIVNALTSAHTMVGAKGRVVEALPSDRVVQILRDHGVTGQTDGRT